MSSDSSLRRVIIMTETPESKQPFSMMHRALYANIVGHETLYTFPHGCTIKQYNGVDYIVDHVTRLARPVSSVPALSAHEHENIKKANEYQNGITKCRAVLSNLQSRFKIAHNQLAKSAVIVERHEATLKSIQERKAAMASSSPIANVIAQRCHDLTTVRALLSLVAQALRAASAEHVRFLKPQQLADLERVAPPLYQKYMAWRNGELQLAEKGEQQGQASGVDVEKEEPNPFDALEGEDELPADEDDEDTDGHREAIDEDDGDQSDEDNGHGDNTDPRDDHNSTPSTEADPDMDDEIVLPGCSDAHGPRHLNGVTGPGDDARGKLGVKAEGDRPSVSMEAQPKPAAVAHVTGGDVGTPGAVQLEEDTVPSTTATNTKKNLRETTLYLPECSQPSISIYCTPCHAYIPYDADHLAAHAESEDHIRRSDRSSNGHNGGGGEQQATLATKPPTALPSYVTHRPIPKRHVRLDDDNSFGAYFTIVRSGCSSCRKDVELGELVSHGTTQEHLDFLDE